MWINTTSSKLVLTSSTGSIGEVAVGPNWNAGTHVLWTNGDTGWELGHSADGTLDYTLSAQIVSTYLLSGTVSAKIPIPTIPRYATSVQSLNSKTETTVTMNWSSDSTIDYIWYSTNNGSTWKGVDVTDGTSGTYKISGLSPNTTYNIKTRVRRKDSQLTTDSTALAVTTYKVPTNSLSSKTETKVTVNWSVDSTADYIWYSINNGSSWVAVGSVSTTSGSYTISGLSPNTAYTIKTRVRRKATQTTYDTSALSITTYKAPTNALKSKTETSITMNWSADSTVDYIWYSKDNGANWTGVDVTDGTSGSYTISGLTANTAYNIKTRIRRKATQTTYDCSTVAVTTYNYPYITGVTTGTLVIGKSQTLNLYNPLGRTVTVKMHQNSTSGTQLYSGTTSGTSITFTPTASTLYASIPSAKSSKCVYSAIYSTSTKTTSQYTYTIDEANCKPTFSNFNYIDIGTPTTPLTGNSKILVDNKSSCRFNISVANKAVAKNSATIVKYKCEWGNKSTEVNYSSDAEVTAIVYNSSGNTLKVTAIDSRGLSTTVTKTITNVPYIDAIVSEVLIQRLNGVDVETYLGLTLKIWKGNWQNGSDTTYDNQLKYIGYRVYDGSAWTSYFDITDTAKSLMSSSSSGTSTTIQIPLSKQLAIHANGTSGGFTIGKSYTIQVLIKDGTSSATYESSSYQATKQGTVPDGKVGFARFKDSDGNYHYAINSMPDGKHTFKVYGRGYFTDDILIPSAPSTHDGTVPYCGGSAIPSTLTDMKNFKTYLGSIHLGGTTWYNMISIRHRNGASDGTGFGMMIYSKLTASGDLFWQKQINASAWQGERTILDSSNYKNYALPLSGGALTGHLYLNGVTDATTTSTSMIIFGNSTTQYGVIRANKGGAIVISNSKTDNTKSVTYDPTNMIFKSDTDAKMALGDATHRWNGLYSSGDIYITKGTGNTYFRAKRSDTGTEVLFGVGSAGVNHGVWSTKMNKWLVYSDGSQGYLNGIANQAQQTLNTLTNPTTGTWYLIPFVAETNGGLYTGARINNGLRYYSLEGTTSAGGRTILQIGNAAGSGTAGNKYGELWLQSKNTGRVQLIAPDTTQNAMVTLPALNNAFIPGYVGLYNNASGTTGTVTLSSSAANFAYIEVFYAKAGASYCSTRIQAPNGKNINLSLNEYVGAQSIMQTLSKKMAISGTSMTAVGNSYGYGNISGTSSNVGAQAENQIYIYKVLGYM